MSAELLRLRQEASALARQFRKAGQGDLADLLDTDARGFGIKAKIAEVRGLKTFAPQTAEQPIGQKREALPLRLKPIPFEIEIPTVSEEVYTETRKAVEAAIEGVFIAPIRSVSIEDLLEEDKERGKIRFNHSWVNTSKTMRATVPPEMEVFINPNAVRIEGSNYLSTDDQKKKLAEAEASFREQLPEAVRPFVILRMVDPSTMSQLEDKYMDERNGELLLPNFFARTDVQTVRGYVTVVGRRDPGYQRGIFDWHRDSGYDFVFAVPVGVLPRKLVA